MMNPTNISMSEESPTAQVIASALAEVNVVDTAGRAITLKKPGVLAQFRLVEMLGDSASNTAYVGMVLPLIYVTAIDGEPVSRVSSKVALDALIQRLDEHGVVAVATGVMEHYGRQDPKADEAALKN